jgi:hypothetical protein
MTLLTFVTRCCRRPDALRRNIESVCAQTSGDWEQLFLVDRTGRHDTDPIVWANRQFERYADCIQGDYVYMLDDDGLLIEPAFVRLLDKTAGARPDVVLVKMRTFNLDQRWRVHPGPQIWDLDWEGGQHPPKWVGNGFCVVVRASVWRDHITHYQYAPGGDWHFVTSLIKAGRSFARLDAVVSESPGRGCGILFEKCGSDWWQPFPQFLDLEHVRDGAWRMTPRKSK